jgi:hypothetical protein
VVAGSERANGDLCLEILMFRIVYDIYNEIPTK